MWLGGCASHRCLAPRSGGYPCRSCAPSACVAKADGSSDCGTPCPSVRCRLWGLGCRLHGVLGDVRWVIREGIVGRPEENIPPGPTPPPILDELFPLPTRPVFYPSTTHDQGDPIQSAGGHGKSAPGSSESSKVTAPPPRGPGKAGSAERRGAAAVQEGAQPEVIPAPAPLPPGDAPGLPEDRSSQGIPRDPQAWDSEGWRTARDVGEADVSSPASTSASGKTRNGTSESSGNPAWVFLPASPTTAGGPQVTVSVDHSDAQGRRQDNVRR